MIRIGKHIYDTRKPTKCKDATIKVRTAMRRLAKLVDATVGISTAAELFVVSNLYQNIYRERESFPLSYQPNRSLRRCRTVRLLSVPPKRHVIDCGRNTRLHCLSGHMARICACCNTTFDRASVQCNRLSPKHG